MTRRTLLLLGARTAQLPAIRAARDMGLRIVAVDPDARAPGLQQADAAYVHDLADEQGILAVARDERIDGVVTMAADYPMPVLATVCAELDLPGPRPEAVARATNKRLMREAFSRAGVECPRHLHAQTPADAIQAFRTLGCHAIFKPAMSHGGRGVRRVEADGGDAEVIAAFQRALAETRADGVMIEEFVDGPEFSVETLTHNGMTRVIAVTDKLTSGPPYFVELGHSQPSRWDLESVDALKHTAVAAVAALGVDQAAGHTEIRLGPRGPVVMEAAARLGGGFITSHLVPLSTGIDMVAATIRVALGETPDLTPRATPRAAAIRFLGARPGVLESVSGVAEALALDGSEAVELYSVVGDHVRELVDSRGRVGHVICTASAPNEAIVRAEQALQMIRVATHPRPSP